MATEVSNRYASPVKAIRVRVENGRITGDAPAGLPDGDLDLCLAESDDEPTGDELARLNAALTRGFAQISDGRLRPVGDVLSDLRRR